MSIYGGNNAGPSREESNHRSITIIAVALVVIAIIAFFGVIPYFNLQKADQLLAEGKFTEAADLYGKNTGNLIFNTRASEGYVTAMTGIAEAAVAAHDFDRAIEAYTNLGDRENAGKVRLAAAEYLYEQGNYQEAAVKFEELKNTIRASEAWTKYGDTLLTSNQYEAAILAYTKAQNENQIQAAHIAWAESLLADGEYDEAAEHYIQADRGDKAREIMLAKAKRMIADGDVKGIPVVLKPYKGEEVAELYFEAQRVDFSDVSSEGAVQNARQFGEAITDPDTQLAYCRLLYEHEYDLKQVYPGGVAVDMDLAQYQFYHPGEEEDNEEPDYSKIIIFSRQYPVPSLEIFPQSTSKDAENALEQQWASRLQGKVDCSVQLRPDLMVDMYDRFLTWSLKECTAYMILDEGYFPLGSFAIRTTSSSKYGDPSLSRSFDDLSFLTGRQSYRSLLYHAAYANIMIYDKNTPNRSIPYNSYVDYPPAVNAIVGNDYQDSGIDLTSLQIDEIQEALQDEDSEASQKILSKYDQNVINFVKKSGWGDYILIPDQDMNGEQKNFKGSADNLSEWNIPKYMIGKPNETWMQEELADGALSTMMIYFLLNTK